MDVKTLEIAVEKQADRIETLEWRARMSFQALERFMAVTWKFDERIDRLESQAKKNHPFEMDWTRFDLNSEGG